MSAATTRKGRWSIKNFLGFGGQPNKAKSPASAREIKADDVTRSEVSTNSSMMSIDSQASDHGQSQEPVKSQPQQQDAVMMAVEVATTSGNFRTISGYEILDTLGKGMSGKVKRGRCPNTGRTVALKIIDKAQVPRRVLMMLNSEIQAMKALQQHPNILCLLDCNLQASYPRKRGGVRDCVCLALELAPGGELFDFLMYTGAFPEDIAKAIFVQLASAIAYCHDHNIYHRDIKPENLLLDENFQLKVADFGLAAIRADPEALLRTECGTRSYMAPEVLARQQYDGKKADCWSVGVVLFIMLSGNPPFQMARPGDWWFNQLKDKKPEKFWRSHLRYSPNFPRQAQDLLTRIFTPDPTHRPTVREILSDPWVTSCPLSPADITRELKVRKEKIIADKAAEKERARKKKEAGQQGGKKDFDPDKVKHRSDGGAADGQVEQLKELKAPLAPSRVLQQYTNNLYTAEGPAYCLKQLRDAITVRLSGQVLTKLEEEQSKFKMVAVVPADATISAEMEIRLYSVPEDETTVIQVNRKGSDLLAFQLAYKKLRAEIVELHGDEEEEDVLRNLPGGMKREKTMPDPVDSDDEKDKEPTLGTSGYSMI